MKAMIGLIIGGVFGWFTGYIVVMSRFSSTDNPFAQGLGSMMAPTAPDTILFTAIGALTGCLIGFFRRNK